VAPVVLSLKVNSIVPAGGKGLREESSSGGGGSK